MDLFIQHEQFERFIPTHIKCVTSNKHFFFNFNRIPYRKSNLNQSCFVCAIKQNVKM